MPELTPSGTASRALGSRVQGCVRMVGDKICRGGGFSAISIAIGRVVAVGEGFSSRWWAGSLAGCFVAHDSVAPTFGFLDARVRGPHPV